MAGIGICDTGEWTTARNIWTRKRLESRKHDEQQRHEERRTARRTRALEQGGQGLSTEETDHHAEELQARRVKARGAVAGEERELLAGLVVAYRRTSFQVELEDGSLLACRTRSTTRTPHEDSTLVAVGDRVLLETLPDGEGVIAEVLPRHNRLSRASKLHQAVEQVLVSNIDQVLIVCSVQEPWLKPGLIDRYLVTAAVNGIESLICFNKIDLDLEQHFQPLRELYESLGYACCATSALSGEGLQELRDLLADRNTVLSGQSGVGKSSLLNALDPALDLAVRKISQFNSKGTHTTTAARLVRLDFGGHVVDTPGIKELALWGVGRDAVQSGFPEIRQAAADCRFADCRHLEEPGCAVVAAVDEGRISPLRFQNYLSILESL